MWLVSGIPSAGGPPCSLTKKTEHTVTVERMMQINIFIWEKAYADMMLCFALQVSRYHYERAF